MSIYTSSLEEKGEGEETNSPGELPSKSDGDARRLA